MTDKNEIIEQLVEIILEITKFDFWSIDFRIYALKICDHILVGFCGGPIPLPDGAFVLEKVPKGKFPWKEGDVSGSLIEKARKEAERLYLLIPRTEPDHKTGFFSDGELDLLLGEMSGNLRFLPRDRRLSVDQAFAGQKEFYTVRNAVLDAQPVLSESMWKKTDTAYVVDIDDTYTLRVKRSETDGISRMIKVHRLLCVALSVIPRGYWKEGTCTVSIAMEVYMAVCFGRAVSDGQDKMQYREYKKQAIRESKEIIEILRKMEVTVKDPNGSEIKSYQIIETGKVTETEILITFTKDFLQSVTIESRQRLPMALMRLDNRAYVAYELGVWLSQYSGFKTTKKKGGIPILKIGGLMRHTSLGEISDGRIKKDGWGRCIRNPLEKALDRLVEARVLDSWAYCSKSKAEVNACMVRSYAEYKKLYIKYSVADK